MLWQNGEACVALAASLFSISSLFVKLTSDGLSVFQICALSSAGCALCLCTYARLPAAKAAPSPAPSLTSISDTDAIIPSCTRTNASNHRVSSSNTGLLVAVRAALGAATILCYYAAVEMGDIRDATALFFTSPLFTLMFDCLLHWRMPSKHHAVSAAFTAAGALMISQACLCLVLSGGGGSSICSGTHSSGANGSGSAHAFAVMTGAADAAATQPSSLSPAGAISLPPARSTLLQQLFLSSNLLRKHQPAVQPRSSAAGGLTGNVGEAFSATTGALPGPELSKLPAVVLALTAAATNSAAFVTIQAIGQRVPALTLTFWHHAATATAAASSQLGILLWLWLQNHSAANSSPDLPAGWGSSGDQTPVFVSLGLRDGALVAGVMASQLLAQVLLNRGFSLTSPTRGAAINVLQVVFSFVWDRVVLGNQPQATTLAGGLFILGGVLIQAMIAKQEHDRLLHEPLQLWDTGAAVQGEGDEKVGGGAAYVQKPEEPVVTVVTNDLSEPLLVRRSTDQASG